jgi:hypothetical protein
MENFVSRFTAEQIAGAKKLNEFARLVGIESDCFMRGGSLDIVVCDNEDCLYRGAKFADAFATVENFVTTTETLSVKAYQLSKQFPTKAGYVNFVLALFGDASDSERQSYCDNLNFRRGGSVERFKRLVGQRWDEAKTLRTARRAAFKTAKAEAAVRQVIRQAMAAAAESQFQNDEQMQLFA